jgi:hypothetical protein
MPCRGRARSLPRTRAATACNSQGVNARAHIDQGSQRHRHRRQQGIGRGIAKVFAAQGAKVTIAAQGEVALVRTCEALNAAGGRVRYAVCNVADWASVQAMVDDAAAAQDGLAAR